jgi:hypothetical protein
MNEFLSGYMADYRSCHTRKCHVWDTPCIAGVSSRSLSPNVSLENVTFETRRVSLVYRHAHYRSCLVLISIFDVIISSNIVDVEYRRHKHLSWSCLWSRISTFFPDYVLSFCVANNKTVPVAKQINETFTQKVSYARRKRLRIIKGNWQQCMV